MDETKRPVTVKDIMWGQFLLLADASKTAMPEHLSDISLAMAELAKYIEPEAYHI